MPRIHVSITDAEYDSLCQVSDATGYSMSSVAAILLSAPLLQVDVCIRDVNLADQDGSVEESLEGLLNDGRRKKRRR